MLTAVARSVVIGFAVMIAGVDPRVVLAASPEPSPATGGDPRSAGEGPGFVGDPGTAIVAVLAIGLATAFLTYVYVYLTRDRVRP